MLQLTESWNLTVRLHSTTRCTTRCTATGCTTGCKVWTFVQPVTKCKHRVSKIKVERTPQLYEKSR